MSSRPRTGSSTSAPRAAPAAARSWPPALPSRSPRSRRATPASTSASSSAPRTSPHPGPRDPGPSLRAPRPLVRLTPDEGWWLGLSRLQYSQVTLAQAQPNLTAVAPYMFWLMFRNIASDGLVFEDPVNTGVLSRPGCVLAAPSWENSATHVSQDYVYNWTRDAAIVAIELAAGPLPTNQPLIDYVQFAQVCQNSAAAFGHFGRASFLINGNPRDQWTDQSDGPALQTLAILQLFARLDGPTQAVAQAVIDANLSFVLGAYQDTTTYFNLWEEHTGASFFTRAVQLRCFEAIQSNTIGIAIPPALAGAITWLQNALQTHWT